MVTPQPSIELFGLIFHTPITAITDVIVAIICLVAFVKLKNLPDQGEVHRLFKYYFLSMCMATFLGGVIGHGLMHYLPFYMKIPGWITSMLSVALLERAVIQYTRRLINPMIGIFFSWLNIFELLTFMVLSLVTLNFQFVLAHAAYGMAIVVTGFTGFIYMKERGLGSKQILLAVLICFVGAFFFVFKIGIHMWFNHVDISHVFMMFSAWYFYKGSHDVIKAVKSPSKVTTH